MKYNNWKRQIESEWKKELTLDQVLILQKDIANDNDLDVYEKGDLLSSWNGYFEEENAAEYVAEIGSEFMSADLADRNKAEGLLKEAGKVITGEIVYDRSKSI